MDKSSADLIEKLVSNPYYRVYPSVLEDKYWKVLCEAGNVYDEHFISTLIEYAKNSKYKAKRKNVYFILGHIAKNTNSDQPTNFLIQRIETEKSKYDISTLLSIIKDLNKPSTVDIQPIINATKSDKWLIRHSAIEALENTNNYLVEDRLLEIINESNDEYDLWYANKTLRNAGTRKSVPSLSKLLDHKKKDVSCTALRAILNISKAVDLPLYISQLQKGKNKTTALIGVIKYGTVTEIPYVVKRIKELVARKRSIETTVCGNGPARTELVMAMEFLSRYVAESSEPNKMYEFLTTKKYDFLWDSEKEWLEENSKIFKK